MTQINFPAFNRGQRLLRSSLAAIVLGLAGNALISATLLAEDGSKILQDVDNIRAPSDNFMFHAKIAGNGQQMMMDVRVHNRSDGLVQFRAPETIKDRKLLFIGRSMWTYIPGTRRPVRISPQQQVLGSVSNAEVARVVFSDDYSVTATGAGEDAEAKKLAGAEGVLKLDLQSSGEGAAYSQITLFVGQASHKPLKAVFMTSSGKAVKSLLFEGYAQVLGRSRPTRLIATDLLRDKAQTTLEYSGMENADTPSAWYNPDYLEKLQ